MSASFDTKYIRLGVITGESLGNELLTNGDFSSSTGWFGTSATTVISGGVCTVTANNFEGISQINVIETGHSYRCQYEIVTITGGSYMAAVCEGGNSGDTNRYNTGVVTVDLTANGTGSIYFVFVIQGGGTIVLDNVSLKEIL